MVGAWAGTHACGQGQTEVAHAIRRGTSAPLPPRLHFGSMADTPSVPSGCFTMKSGDRVEGRHPAERDAIRGEVRRTRRGGVALRRAVPLALDEAACRAGAPPLR